MENREFSAKNVEEAIQKALDTLNVTREEVNVSVLSEGKSGILGLGAEEARISIEPLVSEAREEKDLVEAARGTLEKLLSLMEIEASVVLRDKPFLKGETTASVPFEIMGDDLGILIGRRGQTFACLEYVVKLIVANQNQRRVPIIIDVEGYRQRRYEALQALAWRIAEQVKTRGKPFTLQPMPPYERRIVHLTLADHPDVTTESTGEGEARKVVIKP